MMGLVGEKTSKELLRDYAKIATHFVIYDKGKETGLITPVKVDPKGTAQILKNNGCINIKIHELSKNKALRKSYIEMLNNQIIILEKQIKMEVRKNGKRD
jgi:5'-3' exonuclease